ncbi:MAG: hypothetical protein WCK13_02620 [Ignavibacteriota bacterium]|nr:hypothetical protein [Ignavibacteriota bacterium]
MKKTFTTLAAIVIMIVINGCQQFMYTPSHNVEVYNNNDAKYLTSFYHRDYSYGEDVWSKDHLFNDLDPQESYNIILDEGTYDFKFVLEDDYYSYTMYQNNVYVNSDLTLDVCYDCLKKMDKDKVVKVPKKSVITKND